VLALVSSAARAFVGVLGLLARALVAVGQGCRFVGRTVRALVSSAARAFVGLLGLLARAFVAVGIRSSSALERLAMALLLLGLVWGTVLAWHPLAARIWSTSELQTLLHAKRENHSAPAFSYDGSFPGSERISSVAFSPDGHWIAAARGDNTTLWDATTFEQVQSWNDFPGVNGLVAFSPDGRLLASNDIFTLNIRVKSALNIRRSSL